MVLVVKLVRLLKKDWGSPFVLRILKAGMSATGLTLVMKARPDGYTLGALTYGSVMTAPWQD